MQMLVILPTHSLNHPLPDMYLLVILPTHSLNHPPSGTYLLVILPTHSLNHPSPDMHLVILPTHSLNHPPLDMYLVMLPTHSLSHPPSEMHLVILPTHSLNHPPPDTHLLSLLLKHPVQNWGEPVFKHAVVVVGHQEVADAVNPLAAQLSPWQIKFTKVRGTETLDEVLFDAASCGHQAVHLHQRNRG